MADRYWVGGSGSWTSTSSWSDVSGGSPGFSVPDVTDNVFIDENSSASSFTITLGTSTGISNLDISLSTKTVLFPNVANVTLTIFENLYIAAGAITNNQFPIMLAFQGSTNSVLDVNGLNTARISVSKSGPISFSIDSDVTLNIVNGSNAPQFSFNYLGSDTASFSLNNNILTARSFVLGQGLSGSMLEVSFGTGYVRVTPIGVGTCATIITTGRIRLVDDGYIKLDGTSGGTYSVIAYDPVDYGLVSNTPDYYFNFEVMSNATYQFQGSNATSLTAVRDLKLTNGAVTTFNQNINADPPDIRVAGSLYSGNGQTTRTIRMISTDSEVIDCSAGTFKAVKSSWNYPSGVVSATRYYVPSIVIEKATGSAVTLASDLLTNDVNSFTLTRGELDLAGYDLYATGFFSSNTNLRTITFNNGSIFLKMWRPWGSNSSVYVFLINDLNLNVDQTGTVNLLPFSVEPFMTAGIATGSNGNFGRYTNFFIQNSFGTQLYSGQGSGTGEVKDLTIAGSSTNVIGTVRAYGNVTSAATISNLSITGKGAYPHTLSIVTCASFTVDEVGGEWTVVAPMAVSGTLTINGGTFDANGYTMGIAGLTIATSNVKELRMGGALWTVSAVVGSAFWNCSNTNNFTLVKGASNIRILSPFTFSGGNLAWNDLILAPPSGSTNYMSGSNSFTNIQNQTPRLTLIFGNGSTNTFDNFSLSGSDSSNRVTIRSNNGGVKFYLVSTGADVNVSFCSIQDSYVNDVDVNWNAFVANGNIDNGGNDGWRFYEVEGGAFMAFF